MENSPVGYQVGDVSAVDDDKIYNEVFYKIPNSIFNSVFHVSNRNGTMTLKKSLDRETVDKYIFTLVAFNKDQNGNETLKSSVQVYFFSFFLPHIHSYFTFKFLTFLIFNFLFYYFFYFIISLLT